MNKNQISWEFIPEFDNLYKIYVDGTLVSLHGEDPKVLSPFIVNGFKAVALTKDGVKSIKYVHKLVASAFVPNPENFKSIGFKDGNKENPDATNLKWCTRSELLSLVKGGQFRRSNKFQEGEELPTKAAIVTSSMVLSDKLIVKKTENRIDKEYRMIALQKKKVKAKYETQRNKLEASTLSKKEVVLNSKSKNKESKLREIETSRDYKLRKINKRESEQIFLLSKQVVSTSQIKLETNRFFKYREEFHKITDTGDSLILRVKEGETWKTIPVAKIVLEDIMKSPRPSKSHHVGYRDFDYRNISDLNLIWETSKEKHARYYKLVPIAKISSIKKVKESNIYEINDFKKKDILQFLEKGNSIRAIARKVGVPYWTVYRYCKDENLSPKPIPNKIDLISEKHDIIVEKLKQGISKAKIYKELDFSRTQFYAYCKTNEL